MRCAIVHGPDRLPVPFLGDLSRFESASFPFHQVISRGVLCRAEHQGLAAQDWQSVSPFVDRALSNSNYVAQHDVHKLEPWLGLARESGALSYIESARCAMDFVRASAPELYLAVTGRAIEGRSIDAYELWSIKEGHTSSVWIATVHSDEMESAFRFVLNVARDIEASRELVSVGAELSTLSARNSSAVVSVLGTGTVSRHWDVPILATSLIADGYELHVLPNGRAVAIDRFNLDPADGRRVSSVTIQSDCESDDLWSAILRSWVSLGDWSQPDGPILLPTTEINEGDWVLADGKAVLCGLTPGPLVLSPTEAVEACFSLSATMGYRGGRVKWGSGEKILAILCEAATLNMYPALAKTLRRML